MNLSNKLSKTLRFVLALTMAMILCIGTVKHIDPQMKASAASSVATLKIFSDGSGPAYGTHAFINIKNNSSNSLNILGTTVRPGYSITVGTFGNKNDGKGIYTNLEAYFIKNYGAYSARVSLSMDLNSSQLNTVCNTMKNNNKWTYTSNCSCFAAKVWNSVAPKSKQVSAGLIATPATLSKNIKKISGYKTRDSVGTCDTSNVRRYNGGNSSSSVSSGSLTWSSSGSSNS